MSWNLQPKAH